MNELIWVLFMSRKVNDVCGDLNDVVKITISYFS